VLALARADLERVLAPLDVVDALATVFRHHAAGGFHVPARTGVRLSAEDLLILMPAVSRGPGPTAAAVGFALGDLAAATLAVERARALGVGTERRL